MSDLYGETVGEILELEELDRNLFRGLNTVTSKDRRALYGGQVAAQALMAAGRTVAPDRAPHSLHGYFLRPGKIDRPVILRVDIDRDGRTFSARHVAAIQDGEVIFSMLASFELGERESLLDEMPASEVPGPDDCDAAEYDGMFEAREVTRSEMVDGHMLYTDCLWLRTAHPLADDPLTQACGLTYLSDMGSGFGQVKRDMANGGPSLDHAIWFHAPARADEWLLLHMWPRKAMGIRGLYDATIRNEEGELCAAVAQEHLLIHGGNRPIPGT